MNEPNETVAQSGQSLGADASRFEAALRQFFEAIDEGREPDRQALIRNNPDLAGELEAFFADHDRLDHVAKGMAAAPAAHGDDATTMPLDPHQAHTIGDLIRYVGDYELVREIARGGMGVVYKARQVSVKRMVALKMILSGQFAGASETRRFRAEAETAGNLDHPNIVPIYEVGEQRGQLYFSMKLIEGQSFAQRLSAQEGTSADTGVDANAIRENVTILEKATRAVHFAHQRGIIHRDLKPANVLLDSANEPHVTDFGLAKRLDDQSGVTRTGALVGTPSYMAPEQATSKRGSITTLTDVYALGAMLYEMLAGQPPFRGDDVISTIAMVANDDPMPPGRRVRGVDPGLEAVCLKCLAKIPAERYSSAAALADDLASWLAGEPLTVRPPTLVATVTRWMRKNIRTTALVTGVSASMTAFGSLVMAGVFVVPLLVSRRGTMAHFPSIKPSWLDSVEAILRVFSVFWNWVPGLGFLLVALSFGGIGLALVLLTRPKDVRADLHVGLGGGLAASLAAYLFGFGWAINLALITVPSITDLGTLGKSSMLPSTVEIAKGRHPSDWLVTQYSDLAEVEGNHRGDFFFAKVIGDQVAGSFAAVWLGTFAILGLVGLPVALQTLTAGYLLRRAGMVMRMLLPYAEVSFSVGNVAFGFVMILFSDGVFPNLADGWTLCGLLFASIALVGVTCSPRYLYMPWQRRVIGYLLLLLVALTPVQFQNTAFGEDNTRRVFALFGFVAFGIFATAAYFETRNKRWQAPSQTTARVATN